MTSNEAKPAVPLLPHYLLIDDDESFAKIVTKTAAQSGIRVSWVPTLKDLKKNQQLKGYDAVLLDYDLDTMTGFQVAEILSKTAQDKPVLMVSSTNRPGQDKLLLLPNIVGFVSKWGSPQTFLEKSVAMLQETSIKAAS